jgi:hypothetical protein
VINLAKKKKTSEVEDKLKALVPELFDTSEVFVNSDDLSEESKSKVREWGDKFMTNCESANTPFNIMTEDEKRAYLSKIRNIMRATEAKEIAEGKHKKVSI